MMDTIARWDGNETWLVVIGAGSCGVPGVYAVFLGAFYLPVLLLLLGLIFRGVAFEFRFRSERMRWVWDWGFFLGSTVVAFVQGAAVGAMIRGIPVVDGQYAGSPFGWLHPFAVLTGIGLVLGYALLGAGWLVLRATASCATGPTPASGGSPLGVLVVLFWRSHSRSTTASSREAICTQGPGVSCSRRSACWRWWGSSSGRGRSAMAGRLR
jgi:cytochrome d oxidase subunit CydB